MSQDMHLSLVSTKSPPVRHGGGPAVGAPAPARPPARRIAPGRPWDQVEPWWLAVTPQVRQAAATAAGLGLDFELLAGLLLELGLVCRDLESIGRADRADQLDRAADLARPTWEQSGATGLYLRQLQGGARRPSRELGQVEVCVSIPGRVARRLAAEDVGVDGCDEAVNRALAWERAAVLSCRAMSEWALLTAIRLS